MRMLGDTQAIFEQLAGMPADTDGLAVKAIIENHDACLHNHDVGILLTAAMRVRLAGLTRDPVVAGRIQQQCRRLGALVTPIPFRYSSAG